MKKTITLSLASIVALGLMSFGVLSSGGKTNKTGGHGEAGCTCHAAALSTGVTVNVTSSGTLLTAGYLAGTTYTISITIAEAGQTLFGFDFEALNSANTSVGTLTAGAGNKVSGTAPVNVVHDGSSGLGTGTFTYSFTWQAPAASTGAVTFWYSGLGANNDGGTGSGVGDNWNSGSVVINPNTVGIAEHTIVNNNLSVSPNPVSENVNISYELAANSTVSATLINVTGQVVTTFFTKEEQTAGKQNRKLVMEPSIAKGIYFVAINVNGKNSYKKIVVE